MRQRANEQALVAFGQSMRTLTRSGGQRRAIQLLSRQDRKCRYGTDFSGSRRCGKRFHRLQPAFCELQIATRRSAAIEAPLHSIQQFLMEGFTGLKRLTLQRCRKPLAVNTNHAKGQFPLVIG